jgi:hypothetical protein
MSLEFLPFLPAAREAFFDGATSEAFFTYTGFEAPSAD